MFHYLFSLQKSFEKGSEIGQKLDFEGYSLRARFEHFLDHLFSEAFYSPFVSRGVVYYFHFSSPKRVCVFSIFLFSGMFFHLFFLFVLFFLSYRGSPRGFSLFIHSISICPLFTFWSPPPSSSRRVVDGRSEREKRERRETENETKNETNEKMRNDVAALLCAAHCRWCFIFFSLPLAFPIKK